MQMKEAKEKEEEEEACERGLLKSKSLGKSPPTPFFIIAHSRQSGNLFLSEGKEEEEDDPSPLLSFLSRFSRREDLFEDAFTHLASFLLHLHGLFFTNRRSKRRGGGKRGKK